MAGVGADDDRKLESRFVKRRVGLAGFGLWATLIFGLLVTPWSGLDEIYVRLFRATSNAVFGALALDGQLISPAPGEGRVMPDSRLLMEHAANPTGLRTYVHVRRRAFVPTVLLAGSLGEGHEELYNHGVASVLCISDGTMTFQQALSRTGEMLEGTAERAMRLFLLRDEKSPQPPFTKGEYPFSVEVDVHPE